MRKNFCGWYFRCQSDTQTLAVIPAFHGGGNSVQIITDDGAWNFTENLEGNSFGRDGFKLNLNSSGVSAVGEVHFGSLSPVKYDIMGPFRYIPFMECRHSVISMRHTVDGEVNVNGVQYKFERARGYIEGDRGRSFPSEYVWTQCFFGDNSLMFSVADVPFCGRHFTGIIGVILLHGKEYRLATYLGARLKKISDGEIVIRQGKYLFSAKLIEKNAHELKAPVSGNMRRTIHESAVCRALYRFEKRGRLLFQFESDKASFEFEYGGMK